MNTYTKDDLAPKRLGQTNVLSPYLSADAVAAALNDKVSRSGGSMTGELSVCAGFTVGSRSAESEIGKYSCAFGLCSEAAGDYSVAEGKGVSAIGDCSYAAGENACVHAAGAWAWSGNGAYSVGAAKAGTFSVNPKNGISGFYIGLSSLADCLRKEGGAVELKTSMKTALSAVFSKTTTTDEVDTAQLIAALSAIYKSL